MASLGYQSLSTPDVHDNRDAQARRTLVLFAFMWAVFTFFHQSKWTYWTRTPIESLQTAAAIAVIFRPSALGAFLALVLLQMADLMYTMPNISNHSIFAMFVNMTIVAAAGMEVVRRRGLPLDGGRLLRLFAPAVRLEVIALYFWVVVHKLNTDFFALDSGCAVNHYQHLSGLVRRFVGLALPDQAFLMTVTIYLTLLVEAAIPALLLFARTRIAGVMLGLLFHYVLGVNVFHDFSGMIFALYLLFLPENFVDQAASWVKSAWGRLGHFTQRVATAAQTVPLPAWAAAAAIGLLLATGNAWPKLHRIFFGVWVLYGAACIALFTAIVYARRSRLEFQGHAYRAHSALLIFPAIVLLNGLFPYLGLKTENSFSMFSNLRTEGGRWNHLFIPSSLQIFDFQKDMVSITDSSDPYLDSTKGTSMPFIMLVEYIRKQRQNGLENLDITFLRGGGIHHIVNAETHPELTRSYPWHVTKLQRFRRVEDTPRQPCRH